MKTDLSMLEVLRNSLTVIGFFCMLYCVNSPDWPVTTCWMGAGIIRSSISSYVRLGFQPLGGITCKRRNSIKIEKLSRHSEWRDRWIYWNVISGTKIYNILKTSRQHIPLSNYLSLCQHCYCQGVTWGRPGECTLDIILSLADDY